MKTKAMSVKRMKFGLLGLCTISLSYLSLSPILESISRDLPGVSQNLVQMVLTLPSLMFIIFSPLAGILARKIRKKTIAEIAVICYLAGGLFPFFFHQTIWQLLLGSTVIGCGTGLLMPIINELICDYFDETERGQLMGLNATFVAGGGIVYIFLSGILSSLGWHFSYLAFLLVVPVLIVTICCVPDGIRHETGDKSSPDKKKSGFEMNPYVAALFVIGFIYFVTQNAFNTNSSSYVAEITGGDAGLASLATMANAIGGMIGGTLFGLLMKKIARQIETAAVFIAGLGFLLAFMIPAFVPVLLGGIFVGIGFAMFNAAGTFLLSTHLKPENNGLTTSIYMALINLGAAISPFIVNSVSGLFSPALSVRFLVCALVLLALAVFSLLVNLRKKA